MGQSPLSPAESVGLGARARAAGRTVELLQSQPERPAPGGDGRRFISSEIFLAQVFQDMLQAHSVQECEHSHQAVRQRIPIRFSC